MNPRILTLLAALCAAISLPANIIYEANFTGIAAPDEAQFTFAGGAPKVTRDPSGFYYLGIKGHGSPEIDHGQSLTVTFARPVILQNIQIYRLFDGETAILSVGPDTYRLTGSNGGDAATYSLNGSPLYSLSADLDGPIEAQYALTSMFTLHDPFGSLFITSFELTAPKGSSFGLMSFNTMVGDPVPPQSRSSSVPDSAPTAALLAVALGVYTLRRR